jgi:hypothetical protein
MQRDANNPNARQSLLRRIIVYGVLILVLGCAQCAFFPFLNICPAVPDLILGLLVAISLIDSEKSAGVCAVAAGFFIDAVGSSGIALSPLVYILLVAFISFFTGKMLNSFASYVLLLMPALLYRALATYICAFISYGEAPGLWILGDILIPEALTTGVLCLPIYFIVKLCARVLPNHGRFSF